ncbi:hypothetical protein MATL_G00192090 [Megalops atlanticus]|uniref:UV-stimulated scaffold protein A n=1 Tax=Megalops atlanticus TaxID=7932 RepID=A0A9D3PJF8_MEGAT|nr:hypothetical protein MATL_G00192090 [Megalops atlanticus]
MDHAQREKLSELMEELTTSGEPQLNAEKMKEMKKLCKVSNDYIEYAYHLIMTQLAQEHAEIRLSALQVAEQLFSRSHRFRELLVSSLQEFLELTVETNADRPLPPPREVAHKLKTLAIRTVQAWQAIYGQAYKKLALGYHFLKQVKKVDFNDVQVRTLAERKRQEEKEKRLERFYKEKVTKAVQEMEEASLDIEQCLTEVENCVQLLAPHPTDFNLGDLEPASASQTPTSASTGQHGRSPALEDEQPCCSRDLEDKRPAGMRVVEEEEDEEEEESETEEVSEEEAFIRSSGLMSHGYTLELDISTDVRVKETEENEAVVTTMKDLQRLISTKHLPAVQSWVQVFTKAGGNEALLRRALDLKSALEGALQRHKELHIDYKRREQQVMKAGADEEEDDDLEEVPEKEGFEPHIPDHLREEYGLEPAASSSSFSSSSVQPVRPAPWAPAPSRRREYDEEQDPTCAAATLRILKQRLPSAPPTRISQTAGSAVEPQGGEGVQNEERDKAPVIPFGLDLYYWGQEQPTAGKIIKYSSQHQFWVPNEVEEEVENPELTAQVKSRYITFAGRFQPVTHKCRAPMPSGTLCERQDRVKCPFHGLIVPRDDKGIPLNPEDTEKEKKRHEEDQPDWRDPELMRDIEAATGEDLGSSKTFGKGRKGSKGKGKGKKKYPNLTDLKQSTNTSRSRLERKVFNKSAMRRVTEAMNRMDRRKHEKFANQFNYALN